MNNDMHLRRFNPFVGPRPLARSDRLFGRDREVRDLRDLLIAEGIVLLYSPSGAGKTSVIQAGLIPVLEEERFNVLPNIRINRPPQSGTDGQTNRYVLSAIFSLEEGPYATSGVTTQDFNQLTLEEFLARQRRTVGTFSDDILIFDQFEEILTLDPTDTAAKIEFFKQVGEALKTRDRRALFALREDHVTGLDPYRRWIPTQLATTFRLSFLSPTSALQAIQRTAQESNVELTQEAAKRLIDDLSQVRLQQPDGSTKEVPGPYIEPVQLQVVCQQLWDHLPEGSDSIDVELVAAYGNVERSLQEFYAEAVNAVAIETGVPEQKIRAWFDEHLITKQGIRGQVLQEPGESAGLEDLAIEGLVDRHLVRRESRRGANWFELAHDRLIEPIRVNNDAWYQTNLGSLQQLARLWHTQEEEPGFLLTGEALTQAEQWAKEHDQDLTPIDRAFLADSVNQRELEIAEQRKLEVARRDAETRALIEAQAAVSRRRLVAVAVGALAAGVAIGAAIASR